MTGLSRMSLAPCGIVLDSTISDAAGQHGLCQRDKGHALGCWKNPGSGQDVYGNSCRRMMLPAGVSTVRYDALVTVPDATEAVDLDAAETSVTDLPDSALLYTTPSRYVSSDILGDEAWELFGAVQPGYRRVPRNNEPRKGRVLIGRGRDALDVAMVTTYGRPRLDRMDVWADETGQ